MNVIIVSLLGAMVADVLRHRLSPRMDEEGWTGATDT
jgi:hypothetical protein